MRTEGDTPHSNVSQEGGGTKPRYSEKEKATTHMGYNDSLVTQEFQFPPFSFSLVSPFSLFFSLFSPSSLSGVRSRRFLLVCVFVSVFVCVRLSPSVSRFVCSS